MNRVLRWIRAPKGLTLVALLVLVAIESAVRSIQAAEAVLLVGCVGGVVDLALTRYVSGRFVIPDGGAITGVLIALVVDPTAPVAVPIAGTLAGLVAKHMLRTRWSNIFNPAAVGLLVAYFVPGGSVQSWWGALGDGPVWFLAVLLAVGGFMADRENKLPVVLSFAGVYVVLLTVVGIRQPDQVASAFRVPDLNAALFFALFMLTDPPTSPTRYEHQVIFGSMVAAISAVAFLMGLGVAHFPLALLAANAWESWRRPRRPRVPEPLRDVRDGSSPFSNSRPQSEAR
jgi:Na+-translocating ferredoxin:NAD+ oxidoreductase RnfD subunit